MIRKILFCLPVSLMLSGVFAVSASAAVMNWGDYVGNTITYENVTETNAEPNLLFSMPQVVDDVLEFDPVNFFSTVDPGPGADSIDSELSMVVIAAAGNFIENMRITESGDFTLAGPPGAVGEAKVGAAFFYEVLEVDGVAVGDGPTGSENMVFTTGAGPNGGEYSLINGDAGAAKIWQGEVFLDITAAMDASAYAGQKATKIRLAFDNSLATTADATASAFIRKKQLGGVSVRTNVPEPSSIAITMLLGLTFAGISARRRFA